MGINLFAFMPHRIYAIMNNTILISVPMFVLMGIILQKSRLAERLLEAMAFIWRGSWWLSDQYRFS